MSNRTLCPVCGVGVPIDEDGCCAQCGATATGRGADEVLARVAEAERLVGAHLPSLRATYGYLQRTLAALVPAEKTRRLIGDMEHFLSASPPAAPAEAPPEQGPKAWYLPEGQPGTAPGFHSTDSPEVAAAWRGATLTVEPLFASPPDPSDPLVQAVLDAAERFADAEVNAWKVGEHPEGRHAALEGALDESGLLEAVAALRSSRERNRA